jgi:hypothetical protein
MAGSLMLMVYSDSTGKNVTISPRHPDGSKKKHNEPSYESGVSVQLLAGSGISNGTMTANGMCQNCRSWDGGSVNSTNTEASFIFATGPPGNIKSDSTSADINRHDKYGIFVMDLTKALGTATVPVASTADSDGTVQTSVTNDSDIVPIIHAVCMVLAFAGLMLFGVFLLRVSQSPKWHGINQTIATIIGFVGAIMGIVVGMKYNRVSRTFSNRIGILLTC